jgi:G3E family GTPase
VNLLTEQVEFANVIILNKTDLVNPQELGMLKAMIRKLNSEAKIIDGCFGKVPLSDIMHTRLFDLEKTSQSAGWIAELDKTHVPETEEYGISSFVFRDKRPFHPTRFWDYLNKGWHSNIIRSKGLFWIASRKDDALNWSQAGGSLRAEKAGVWLSNADRHNEIVIIGQGLAKEVICQELVACLCTDKEIRDMGTGLWLRDPFPLDN